MQLTHVAIWTNDPERSRDFYVTWFDGKSNEKYVNLTKGFSSYFISFEGGASLEIMQRTDITQPDTSPHIGLAHIAFYAGTKEKVNSLIERFRQAGYVIVGEPRFTGDGYYEGAVLDPDGNLVEIVAYKDVTIARSLFYPYDLLLLADPDQAKVDAYLPVSDCFVAALDGTIVGVIVVQKQGGNTAEVMNLAVLKSFQRRGIARKLLKYIADMWSKKNEVNCLLIRTGTSAPGPFMLYQQEGFELIDVQYDYFLKNYKEAIVENNIHCKHQLILEKRL